MVVIFPIYPVVDNPFILVTFWGRHIPTKPGRKNHSLVVLWSQPWKGAPWWPKHGNNAGAESGFHIFSGFIQWQGSVGRAQNLKTRWWFQIYFMFTPIWGRFPSWRTYFSIGLKPPTSIYFPWKSLPPFKKRWFIWLHTWMLCWKLGSKVRISGFVTTIQPSKTC